MRARREGATVVTGTALLVPGRAYPHGGALLDLPRQALERHGWTPVRVTWDPARLESALATDAATAYVEDEVAAASARGPAPGAAAVVVGKSLGTLASTWVARRGWPAVWLTPLLHDASCVAGIRANPAPQLLVGGTEDHLWDPVVAAHLAAVAPDATVLELEDADHALEARAGAVRSAEHLLVVTRAVEAFLARVGPAR